MKWSITLTCFCLLLLCAFVATPQAAARKSEKTVASSVAPVDKKNKSWYVAVSGDSRDCGDIIMPKIARDIADTRAQSPVEFYWHLGDLRGMFRIDCDVLKRKHPDAKCYTAPVDMSKDELRQYLNDFNDYLKFSWDDFVEHQIDPFGQTPFVLGIGNHELVNRTREDFRLRFSKWLTQPLITAGTKADVKRNIPASPGKTYFHFVKNGVDFIYLDNADNADAFSAEQLAWLAQVLKADAKDKSIKTIIAGMHAALPQSTERGHAMDATCDGLCTGLQAYNLLYQAQNLSAKPALRKHVYVFASHSHFFRENIYDTREHQGKVLPGWIIGTGGAEQYIRTADERIMYGYMMVEICGDGTISTRFREVGRDSAPLVTGPGAQEITQFCFEQNRRKPTDKVAGKCSCPAGN